MITRFRVLRFSTVCSNYVFIITVTGRIGFTGVFGKCPLFGFHDNDGELGEKIFLLTRFFRLRFTENRLRCTMHPNTIRNYLFGTGGEKPLITRRYRYRKSLYARLRREQIVRCAGG